MISPFANYAKAHERRWATLSKRSPSAADFLASPLLPATACLVADVQMPGMTGVELHRHLVDAGHAIPTILVTAYPDEISGTAL